MKQEKSRVFHSAASASTSDLVLSIVGDHLGIPGPTLSLGDHIMGDLGADSLDRLELFMTVEELFGVKIPSSKIGSVNTIGDLVNVIEESGR